MRLLKLVSVLGRLAGVVITFLEHADHLPDASNFLTLDFLDWTKLR